MADKLFRMLFKDRLKQHQENIEEKNCRGDREYWALPTIEKLILSVWVLKKNFLLAKPHVKSKLISTFSSSKGQLCLQFRKK